MSTGDEFVIVESTEATLLLKKKDLRAILEGAVKEARKLDLDKLEKDVEEEATGLHERNTRFSLDMNAICKLL
jgi:hypothetical protein